MVVEFIVKWWWKWKCGIAGTGKFMEIWMKPNVDEEMLRAMVKEVESFQFF